MKAYEIQYLGVYLGGNAVVVASSEEEALRLLRELGSSNGAKNATIVAVNPLEAPCVLYNDNGDY